MRSAHIWSVSEPPKWASHPQPGSLRKKSREINNSARASFPPHFCFLSAPSFWRLSQINSSCASNYFSFQNFSHGWIRAPHLLTADSLNARDWKHHVLGGRKQDQGWRGVYLEEVAPQKTQAFLGPAAALQLAWEWVLCWSSTSTQYQSNISFSPGPSFLEKRNFHVYHLEKMTRGLTCPAAIQLLQEHQS